MLTAFFLHSWTVAGRSGCKVSDLVLHKFSLMIPEIGGGFLKLFDHPTKISKGVCQSLNTSNMSAL